MTKKEAEKFIQAGEGQNIEFKETLAELNDAIQTLAAFGSQGSGGVLFFGINDNGQIVKADVGKNTIENLANDIKRSTISMVTAKPLVPEIYLIRELPVIAVYVNTKIANDGPYLASGYLFKRSGKSTHKVKVDYRALANVYQQHLLDEEAGKKGDPLPYRFCPECGNQKIEYSSIDDFFAVHCPQCGWSEGSH